MRNFAKYATTMAAVAVLSLPVWARTQSATLIVEAPMQIGTTQLERGTYEIRASEGQDHVTVVKDGKAVVEVPCQWIQLNKRASQSEIVTSENRVTEIDFGGKTEAVQIR
jgi:hypothetical protein